MAKKYGQKIRILHVLDILKGQSDEFHPVTAEFIRRELLKIGIEAERKAVYSDISALLEYGCDIVKSVHPRGWFLGAREFEVPEIYILADAVRTAGFISASKTRELVGKLDSFASVYQRAERENRVYFSAESKCANEQIFYSIDKISAAASAGRKIEFDYTSRVLSPERRIEKRFKHMKVSPYALVWNDDHYYMIANYEKYDNLMHVRVDRMLNAEITGEPARNFSEVSEYRDFFDASDYTRKLFGMHGGRIEEIELCCSRDIIEQAADRFGEGIFIKNVTDSAFSFSVKAAVSEAFVTWIINYGDKIRVVSPPSLAEMVKKRAEKVLKLYSDG